LELPVFVTLISCDVAAPTITSPKLRLWLLTESTAAGVEGVVPEVDVEPVPFDVDEVGWCVPPVHPPRTQVAIRTATIVNLRKQRVKLDSRMVKTSRTFHLKFVV